MKDIKIRSAIISRSILEKYLDLKTVRGLCDDCDNYKSNWSCPPFTDELDSNYNYAVVIAGRVKIADVIEAEGVSIGEVMTNVFFERRAEFTEWLLQFEELFDGVESVAAGACQMCELCARLDGVTCRHPEKVRPSLEAYGFDVQSLSKHELSMSIEWPAGGTLPEYMTTVGALLINNRETLRQIAHIMKPLEV